MLVLLGDVAGERDGVVGAPLGDVGAERLLPPAVADDDERRRRGGRRAAATMASIACSTCLCGTRRPSTQSRGAALRGDVEDGRRRGAVVDDRDALAPHAEGDELAAGGAGHRDVLRTPVEPGREDALDPPADPAQQAREDDGPLLPVHVVDQDDDRRAGGEAGEERQPVLHVDDEVDLAEPSQQQVEDPERVDPEVVAAAHVAHAVDDLVARRVLVGGAEDRGPRAALDQAPRHRLDVALRTATLGVLGVAPVEQHDVPALEGRRVGSACMTAMLPASSVPVPVSSDSGPCRAGGTAALPYSTTMASLGRPAGLLRAPDRRSGGRRRPRPRRRQRRQALVARRRAARPLHGRRARRAALRVAPRPG